MYTGACHEQDVKCYLRFKFLISATQRLSKTVDLQVDLRADPKEVVGFDITTLTAKPMQQARLNAQFAAALYLRCLATPDAAAKRQGS